LLWHSVPKPGNTESYHRLQVQEIHEILSWRTQVFQLLFPKVSAHVFHEDWSQWPTKPVVNLLAREIQWIPLVQPILVLELPLCVSPFQKSGDDRDNDHFTIPHYY
jgi:hypothetical protein